MASFRGGHETPFANAHVGKARADVFFPELGIVGDDLLMRHAGDKPSEHVGDGNAHPTATGSPTALAGFNSGDVLIPHIPVLNGSCIMHPSQDGGGPREQTGLLRAIQISYSGANPGPAGAATLESIDGLVTRAMRAA
jgi:hypothetical protein